MGRVLDDLARLGCRLMESGADSRTTRNAIERVGRAVTDRPVDCLVSDRAVVVSGDDEDGPRTRMLEIGPPGVDMNVQGALGRFVREARRQRPTPEDLHGLLERVAGLAAPYPRWLTVLMIGFACASFSRLFGGSPGTMAIAGLAAATGFTVRLLLADWGTNPNAATVLCALISGTLAGTACWLHDAAEPATALSASVLYLVPGVPMVNAVEDLLHGHMAVGAGRALQAVLSLLGIALGLLVAVRLTGAPL